RRVFASPRGDDLIDVAFLPQEAQDRMQRREADRALAQPLGVQPVLVKIEARREDVRDCLVQAGDEDATYAGSAHRWQRRGNIIRSSRTRFMILTLQRRVHAAVAEAARHTYNLTEVPPFSIEVPPGRDLGDLGVTVAFQLARLVRKPPRAIAQELAGALG